MVGLKIACKICFDIVPSKIMIRIFLFFFLFVVHSIGFAAQPGEFAPGCAAKMMGNDNTLNLANYKNQVILIDFWATWCPPCKQSMPFLNALRNELHESGFEIIAINVDEDTQEAKTFLDSYPVDYLMAYDSKGDCPTTYDVKAMPSSYFIDRQGKIRYVHLGFRHSDEIEIRARVMQLLQEK